MGKALGTTSSPSVHSNVFGLVSEDMGLCKTVDMASSPYVARTANTV
jgi:hypothetical protein